MRTTTLILPLIAFIMMISPAQAQSIGGGLGGDRPQFYASRPVVVNPKAMTCSELANAVDTYGKVRVNVPSAKTSVFYVIFSRKNAFCGGGRHFQGVMVETSDSSNCNAGVICGP